MTSKRNLITIAGIADDLGVQRVGGRVGAAHGPSFFRQQFKILENQQNLSPLFFNDIGDAPALQAELGIENLDFVAEWVNDQTPETSQAHILVGGGHDHGYTQLKALKIKNPHSRIGCINIDAHLDLRPVLTNQLPTSGSPYFLAIENNLIHPHDLVEFGVQRFSNHKNLWNYADSKKIRIRTLEDLLESTQKIEDAFKNEWHELSKRCDQIALSLDLDAIPASEAPGVSAPQTFGLTANQVLGMVRYAARDSRSLSFGIFELNPLHDVNQKTAKLAASLAIHFAQEKLFHQIEDSNAENYSNSLP